MLAIKHAKENKLSISSDLKQRISWSHEEKSNSKVGTHAIVALSMSDSKPK